MQNPVFVRSCAVIAFAASAGLLRAQNREPARGTVPAGIGDVFGSGGSSSDGWGSYWSGDQPRESLVEPASPQGPVGVGTIGRYPPVVPLAPGFSSGLVGLAMVGLIALHRRRRMTR